jgi:hypothetical protein
MVDVRNIIQLPGSDRKHGWCHCCISQYGAHIWFPVCSFGGDGPSALRGRPGGRGPGFHQMCSYHGTSRRRNYPLFSGTGSVLFPLFSRSDILFQSVRCTFETVGRSLNVWVEPCIWELSEERPIVQLEVKTDSFTNHFPTHGAAAVADVVNPCQFLGRCDI